MTIKRRSGYYYSVGKQKHMMLLGIYAADYAKWLRGKKIKQGYTTALRSTPAGTELYIRQD